MLELPQELLGRSPVEAPFAFLQEQVEVVFGDAVVFSHMPFRLVPEVLDAVDMVTLVREQLGVVDPQVMEIRDVERVIACQAIRVDDAIRHDHALHDGHQGLGADVGDHLGVDPATPLEDAEDGNLAGGATPALALPFAAEIALVHLHLTGEWENLVQLPGDDLAETMVEIGRRGLVDAHQIGRRTGGHFPDEKLKQAFLLFFH